MLSSNPPGDPAASRVKCPTCKKLLTWDPDNRWRPFCSERCKLIDLGDWLEEQHRIPDKPDYF